MDVTHHRILSSMETWQFWMRHEINWPTTTKQPNDWQWQIIWIRTIQEEILFRLISPMVMSIGWEVAKWWMHDELRAIANTHGCAWGRWKSASTKNWVCVFLLFFSLLNATIVICCDRWHLITSFGCLMNQALAALISFGVHAAVIVRLPLICECSTWKMASHYHFD